MNEVAESILAFVEVMREQQEQFLKLYPDSDNVKAKKFAFETVEDYIKKVYGDAKV